MPSTSTIIRRKYSLNTRLRKSRQRARDLWRQLQHEGWESLEELQCVADELKLPETWQGWKPSDKPGMENVTPHDLLPSIRTIRTLVANFRRHEPHLIDVLLKPDVKSSEQHVIGLPIGCRSHGKEFVGAILALQSSLQ